MEGVHIASNQLDLAPHYDSDIVFFFIAHYNIPPSVGRLDEIR